MRQFCNFLLLAILVICLYLMVFEGFAAPVIPTLGDALLRFLAAACLQLLAIRTGKNALVHIAPAAAAFLLAVWGFFLFLTSPSWQGAVLGSVLADYVTPLLGCCAGWLVHRKLYL